MDLAWINDLSETLEPLYVEMSKASAAQALRQIAGKATIKGDLSSLLKQADARAIDWAKDRAASMVGKKWIDGALVDNPNSKWVIEDATRDMLREKIGTALEKGWTKDQLAKSVEDVFGRERARNIAQTELAFAHSASNRIGWGTSGRAKSRYSLLSDDHVGPDVCDDNADAGEIPMGDLYPSGDEGYPFHPRCGCAEVVVIGDPDEAETPEEAEDEE